MTFRMIIVRFYEFRNPLEDCEVGGQPSCCDDTQQNSEACTNSRPLWHRICVLAETIWYCRRRPDYNYNIIIVFPHFTPGNGGNSATFNEGPGGFLSLFNPFTITNRCEWMVRVLIFILLPPLAYI